MILCKEPPICRFVIKQFLSQLYSARTLTLVVVVVVAQVENDSILTAVQVLLGLLATATLNRALIAVHFAGT